MGGRGRLWSCRSTVGSGPWLPSPGQTHPAPGPAKGTFHAKMGLIKVGQLTMSGTQVLSGLMTNPFVLCLIIRYGCLTSSHCIHLLGSNKE